MIYTSYYAKMKKLHEAGITPVAISRGVPRGFSGPRIKELAPTWAMLKMSDEDYEKNYEKLLQSVDRCAIIKALEEFGDVALLCWEKDINQCHRKRVAEWLREGGCEVEEFLEEDEIPPLA